MINCVKCKEGKGSVDLATWGLLCPWQELSLGREMDQKADGMSSRENRRKGIGIIKFSQLFHCCKGELRSEVTNARVQKRMFLFICQFLIKWENLLYVWVLIKIILQKQNKQKK